eukprot:m.267576 g.267576  ORF g.267576 m.267576 type:complete len:150 (+) comp54718_c0_seq10:578-1027(+)
MIREFSSPAASFTWQEACAVEQRELLLRLQTKTPSRFWLGMSPRLQLNLAGIGPQVPEPPERFPVRSCALRCIFVRLIHLPKRFQILVYFRPPNRQVAAARSDLPEVEGADFNNPNCEPSGFISQSNPLDRFRGVLLGVFACDVGCENG